MRRFTDNAGREWVVSVNVAAVKRVRALTGVDLLGLLDPAQGVSEKLADPVTLCDVLFAVVQPDADRRGVTSDDFGASMAGDAIDAAVRALLPEVVDFSQSRQYRELGHKMLAAAEVIVRRRAKALADAIQNTTPEALAEQVLSGVGTQSTSAPESSD